MLPTSAWQPYQLFVVDKSNRMLDGRHMKLSVFLAQHGLSHADFAKQIADRMGETLTGEAVRLWAAGDRVPRPAAMAAIEAVTAGMVQPNDFFGRAA